MTKNPITISPNDSVGHTMDIFDRYQIKSIPVVVNDELVGMVTKQDVYTKSINRQEKSHYLNSIYYEIQTNARKIKAPDRPKKHLFFYYIIAL